MPDAPSGPSRDQGSSHVSSVVHFREEGTMYDVPIDVLWGFMNWEGHGTAHAKSVRDFQVLEESPNRVTVTHESFRGGAWQKITSRVVDFPPLGRVVEEVEGPYQGTQMVFLYTPVGGRTRLDIIARFVSDVLSPEVLEHQMVDSLQGAGAEDEPFLMKFAQARSLR